MITLWWSKLNQLTIIAMGRKYLASVVSECYNFPHTIGRSAFVAFFSFPLQIFESHCLLIELRKNKTVDLIIRIFPFLLHGLNIYLCTQIMKISGFPDSKLKNVCLWGKGGSSVMASSPSQTGTRNSAHRCDIDLRNL